MQYVKNRPDIPNELITAPKDGNVVFICGAGVSCQIANLPLFKELIKGIYSELDEEMETGEEKTFNKNKYDETLWALEKRLGGGRAGRKKITKAIHQILAEPYINVKDSQLTYHKILLELSNENPLITTNFDTLFEKSTQSIISHTGPAFPDIKDEEYFQGVIHLHGRLKDEKQNLDNSPLILTIRDFAEAYMREGWASRFLYKIARKYHIVFIGYSAEDHFLKLLLSAITEDRKIYTDMKTVYAFTRNDYKGFWDLFEVQPILFDDYDSLYERLKQWREEIDDPDFAKEQLRGILSKTPEETLG